VIYLHSDSFFHPYQKSIIEIKVTYPKNKILKKIKKKIYIYIYILWLVPDFQRTGGSHEIIVGQKPTILSKVI
jgi:hypothetical protein